MSTTVTTQKSAMRRAGFTLVEIMIVVLIIGVLLSIALPNFVAARETARSKACVGNLKQIDSACQQYAMDNKLSGTSWGTVTPTVAGLSGVTGYIRITPACPERGNYALPATPIGEATCSVSVTGSSQLTADAVDYSSGGKWFHGLSN